jgi:hypothetical protein
VSSANVYEFAPVELGKEDCNVDITIWACGTFGVGTEEVGRRKRRIDSNDR